MENKKKWEFSHVSSKGEAKFKRFTEETIKKFLNDKNIKFLVVESAHMIFIYIGNKKYQYFYTTGRWGVNKKGLQNKYYSCCGIEDFFENFLKYDIEKANNV